MFSIFKRSSFKENEFWYAISLFDWMHEGNDMKVLEPAVRYLSKKSIKDIERFQDLLAKFLYKLDGISYAMNIGEEAYVDKNTYFSPDGFLYSRCVVVANGKSFYKEVISNPSNMPKDLEFESILYLAGIAYERKTGKEFDYSSDYNFETFSNKKNWQ